MLEGYDMWTCVAAKSNHLLRFFIIVFAATGLISCIATGATLFYLTCRKPTGLRVLATKKVIGALFCLVCLIDTLFTRQDWKETEASQEGINAAACLLWYSHFPHCFLARSYFLTFTLFAVDRTLEVTRKFNFRLTMEDSRILDYYLLIISLAIIFSFPRFLTVNIDKPGVCKCALFSTSTPMMMLIYAEVYLWTSFAVFVCILVLCVCCVAVVRWGMNHDDVMRADDWADMWPRRGVEMRDGHESEVNWMSPSVCTVPLIVSAISTQLWDICLLVAMVFQGQTYTYNGTLQQVGVLLQLLHQNIAFVVIMAYLPRVRKAMIEGLKQTVAAVKPRIMGVVLLEMAQRIHFPSDVIVSPKNSGT